ncbi:MAG TPA: hypothetical protein VH374_11550 [Polyangia bacterium]|nr:hypothetical protein [Polyangia bacterium]
MKRGPNKPPVAGVPAVVFVACLAVAGGLAPIAAHAQATAGARPAGSVPSPIALPTTPGMRVGSAQIPVVGGNSAGARERALDEALRQTVDLALSDIVDAPTRATQAKAIRALMARARGYVRRYRTLEEGESAGTYVIRVEAEVDEPALRRATERWSSAAASPVAPSRTSSLSLLVVSSGAPEAGAATVAALGAVGIAAQLGDGSLIDPARAVQTAAKSALGAVAFVSSSLTDEGSVRGPGKESVSCRLGARVVAVPSGQLIAEPTAQPRVFADRAAAARTGCLSRAASELAGQLVPLVSSSAPAFADLRAITVDAAVTEPAAVPALLKSLRGLGAVSAAELRRLSAGRAEIKVQTRLGAAALATALAREATAILDLTAVEPGGDTVRLQARLRPAPTPVPTAATGTPTAPAP